MPIKSKITRVAKRAYLQKPFHCPVCGSDQIEASEFRPPDGDAFARQNVRCLADGCGHSWDDTYKLVNVILDSPDAK